MSQSIPENNPELDSARYALLRRLAPGLLHDMAGALQPLGMTAAIIEKRMQSPTPDLVLLGKASAGLKAQSRDATEAFGQLMSWLTPNTDQLISVNAGVQEVVNIMARELSNRGFEVFNQTMPTTAMLRQSFVRNVFAASLVAMTDTAESPGRISLMSTVSTSKAIENPDNRVSHEISLTLGLARRAAQDESIAVDFHAYRKLDWDDVRSLAAAEKVSIERTSDGVVLHIKT